MLGGTSAVMVFNFASISSQSVLSKLGINIGEDSLFNFDIPIYSIPFYLDEQKTGVVIDDHERTINVEFEQDSLNNYERVISSDVKMTLKAQKDNKVLNVFLALFEKVLKYLPEKAYKIYLYYDDVFLTNAGLKEFASSTMQNTDTRIVSFTLTNRTEKSKATATVLASVAGDLAKGFIK
jgi:hypothetical protein